MYNLINYEVGPARAGMIRCRLLLDPSQLGWPRTSGDDPILSLSKCLWEWLAPHERG